ncbi:hypothetical protein P7C70_g2878, partial [Phenoliferia sp. Uapishka_3]
MTSPPQTPPTLDDFLGSPRSTRNVSDGETLRALAALDSPAAGPSQSTPQPSRRRSMKDRTPRQVQSVLSARKSKTNNASARKMLQSTGKQLNDQTPMHLMRTLSRMGDMPPPTPDEEPQEDGRRDSLLSRRGASQLGDLGEEEADSEGSLSHVSENASDPAVGDLGDDEGRPPTPQQRAEATTPDHPSSARTLPSSSTQMADLLRIANHPLPPRPVFNPFLIIKSAGLASACGSQPKPSQFSQDDGFDPRRASAHSTWSVEDGRRQSIATSLGGSPGHEDNPELYFQNGSSPGALSIRGRISGVSSAEFGDGSGERMENSSNWLSDYPEGSAANLLYGADNLEKRRRTFGSVGPRSDDGELEGAKANLPGRRDSVKTFGDINAEVEEVDFLDDFGGGGDMSDYYNIAEGPEDLTDRIPWDEKGKGPIEEEEGDEEVEGADEVVEQEAGLEGFSDEEEPVIKTNMSKAPSLTKTAAHRKKRIKKQRFTSDGCPVPDLPMSLVKSLFQHYLGPNVKLDLGTLDAVMDASHDFFDQMINDASAFARHAGRERLAESDLVTMMYRERVLSEKCSLQALGRQHGLDRELQGLIDAMGPDGKGTGSGGRKRKRKARGDSDDEQIRARRRSDGQQMQKDEESGDSEEEEDAEEEGGSDSD